MNNYIYIIFVFLLFFGIVVVIKISMPHDLGIRFHCLFLINLPVFMLYIFLVTKQK